MKKNELKKILSLAVVTIMCVAVTACGQTSASSSESTDTVVAQESTTEDISASSEMPNGDNAPEKPDGEAPDGAPGEKPDGEAPGNPPEGGERMVLKVTELL